MNKDYFIEKYSYPVNRHYFMDDDEKSIGIQLKNSFHKNPKVYVALGIVALVAIVLGLVFGLKKSSKNGKTSTASAPGTNGSASAPGTNGSASAPGTNGSASAPGTNGSASAPGTNGSATDIVNAFNKVCLFPQKGSIQKLPKYIIVSIIMTSNKNNPYKPPSKKIKLIKSSTETSCSYTNSKDEEYKNISLTINEQNNPTLPIIGVRLFMGNKTISYVGPPCEGITFDSPTMTFATSGYMIETFIGAASYDYVQNNSEVTITFYDVYTNT